MSSEGKSRRIQDADQSSAKRRTARKNTARAAAARSRHHGGLLSMDSEQSARLLLFGVTAVVLIAAAAFIGIGYYVSVIQPRHRTVMEVDGIKISYSEMKRRMAFEYFSNPGLQNQQSLFSIPQIAYRNTLDELTLIARAEPELGVTVTDEEFQERLRTRIGVADGASDQVFSDSLRTALANSHLHRDEFERQVRADVLGDKVSDKLLELAPAAVPQAKVEVIAAQDQAAAQQAIDRIKAGEPFADVAKALSQEAEVQTSGGLKDFNFDRAMPEVYRDFAFTAPIGELSGPLVDPSGQGAHWVVRVIDRQDQPLREDQKPLYESETYRQWLTDTQSKMVIVDKWSNDNAAQASAAEPLIQDLVDKQRRAQEPRPTIPIPTIEVTSATTPATNGTPDAQTPAAASTAPAASPPAASTPSNGQ
jgi:parvulin-like peptidyl-prolyl isomerase